MVCGEPKANEGGVNRRRWCLFYTVMCSPQHTPALCQSLQQPDNRTSITVLRSVPKSLSGKKTLKIKVKTAIQTCNIRTTLYCLYCTTICIMFMHVKFWHPLYLQSNQSLVLTSALHQHSSSLQLYTWEVWTPNKHLHVCFIPTMLLPQSWKVETCPAWHCRALRLEWNPTGH